MANDIDLAKSGEPIKNGSLVVATSPRADNFQFINTYAYNKPVIADIEAKYDERFDDRTYYTIGSSTLVGA